MDFADTPEPPYFAVIFTSKLKTNSESYNNTSNRMIELVKEQEGFLGVDSARDHIGITVSYWKNLDAIKKWRNNSEHLIAQEEGRLLWYNSFNVRICKVEKDYNFSM